MKKILCVLVVVLSISSAVNAQVDGKAIGVRFGYGGEVSYQHPLGNANRLELDLGVNSWGLSLNGVYQWVWDLSDLAEGFNWYAGVGGALGIHDSSYFGVGVLGQVGIEYNFNIPLQVSVDYRPGLYFAPKASNIFHPGYDGVCLAARYKF